MPLNEMLVAFQNEHVIRTKGQLACVLYITRRAKEVHPLDPATLRTNKKGQVRGLGREPVQKILSSYGMIKVLAEEGGRTSRGSLGLAEAYVDFLNKLTASEMEQVEKWWVDRIRDLWRHEKLKVNIDLTNSLSTVVAGILSVARARQKETPGAMIEGTVLQHLVGAKLDIISGQVQKHHHASTSDASSKRPGDFQIGDTAIHVSVTPSDRLIDKCRQNLSKSLRPIVVCPRDKVEAAKQLADNIGIRDRVEVYPAEEFISANINELAKFSGQGILKEARKLIRRYNEIVAKVETDPSLQIEDR